MRHCFYLVFGFLALGFLYNCTSEPKEEELLIEDILPGYWEMLEAKRNGNNVPSLKDAYFEFDTLQTMTTNYSGAGQIVSTYKIVDNSIMYKEANSKDQKLDFTIKSPDTIVFNTVLRKIHKFELTLLRSEKEK